MRKRRTVYYHNGYKLRSYTELMWARLMDAVDIFYLYEPDLIQVDGCKYLPDFYLPAADVYLEVKGTDPTPEEVAKAEQAFQATGRPVVFLIARPQSDRNGFMNCCILAPAKTGWMNLSLHDFDQMYLELAGRTTWVKALLSVREDDMDWVQPIGQILDEVLLEMVGRHATEDHLRMTHKRTNEERSAVQRDVSLAEQGISWWRNRYHPAPTPPVQLNGTMKRGGARG